MNDYDFYRPESLSDALDLLQRIPDAGIVAGGTDMMVLMKDQLVRPPALISLSGLKDLVGINPENGGWRVGSMTPLWQMERSEVISKTFPALHQAILHLAVPPIRNRATLGGNICLDTKCIYYNQSQVWERSLPLCLKAGGDVCHVAPAGKRCVAALAAETIGPLWLYDAELELASSGGTRRVYLQSFHTGDGLTPRDLATGEMLIAVHLFPATPRSGVTYSRFAYRKALEFSQLNLSAAVGLDDQEKIVFARLVIGAIGPAPVELKESISSLLGRYPSDAPWDRVVKEAATEALRLTRSPRLTPYLREVLSASSERLFKEALNSAISN
jgi:4-hydroxybenzoyl-CoA reductase subunit beta